MDSIILSDDGNLDIPRHNLVRTDDPANTKRGSVFLYFRNSLPLRILDIHFLHECINFEKRIGNKVCNFISLYRSPNQSLEEFETFAGKQAFLIFLHGNLIVKLSKWCENDSTSYKGTKIDGVTPQFGMQQLTNETTHILPASYSCIDLIFLSEPNLVMKLGVHSSLHEKCHHEII